MKVRVHLVAGARPNFMKVGPVYHALSRTTWAAPVLVHTGQHFSADMTDVFVRDLKMPAPDIHLQATGDTHGTQTASVLAAYEAACLADRPRAVVVVGDVNSTLAACLAAKKLDIPVAHLEAGLRSGDRRMPEEINRLAVDAIADRLWTPSPDADDNLMREGVSRDRITRVGNVMIDAYCLLEGAIEAAAMAPSLDLSKRKYVVVTMHRPSNVDQPEPLAAVVAQLVKVQRELYPVVFPVHPRTRARLERYSLLSILEDAGVRLLAPLGYVDFMSLVKDCAAVVTDSGGVQEETSYLGVPCLTVRDTTERPITITLGTNRLIAIPEVAAAVAASVAEPPRRTAIPLWDGQAAGRVVTALEHWLQAGA
jgi:UDP-N-acetylglucosamine 2-epimerase (non-hydrolysing)